MVTYYRRGEGYENSTDIHGGGFGAREIANNEREFEKTEKQISEFLGTSLNDLIANDEEVSSIGKFPKQFNYDRLLYPAKGEVDGYQIKEAIEKRLSTLFANYVDSAKIVGKESEAANFLANFLLNDRLNNSNRPACFTLLVDENEKLGWVDCLSDTSDNRFSYRTLFYQQIIKALEKIGPLALPEITACLENISSVRYINNSPVKVGFEIPEKEYNKIVEQESKEFFLNKILDYEERIAELSRMSDAEWAERAKDDFRTYSSTTREQQIENLKEGIDRIKRGDYSSFDDGTDELMEDTIDAGGLPVYDFYESGEGEFTGAVILAVNAIKNCGGGVDKKARQAVLDRFVGYPTEARRIGQDVFDIFNQDFSGGAATCFEKLKTEKDAIARKLITKVLYRLELGQINLDGQTVEYLGKKFEIAGLSNEASFANRATADGKVAIFDSKKRALGYFQLEGLDLPEKVVKAEFLEFTYETLFYPNPKETPEERAEREKILEQFRNNYFTTYLSGDFYEKTKTHFNNLSFKEQGWFLWYISQAEPLERERAMEFIRKYGENGFKTFISFEVGGKETVEKIISFGEKADVNLAQKLFANYRAIVEIADGVMAYLQKNFAGHINFKPENIGLMRENLLRRGKEILLDLAGQSEAATDKKSFYDIAYRKLRRVSAGIITLGAVIREMSRDEVSNLDIQNVPLIEKIENITGVALFKDKALLEKILECIRQQFPAGDDEVFIQEIKNNKNIFVTVSLVDGEVLSFFAKKKIAKNEYEIDWFISNPDIEAKGLGEATIQLDFKQRSHRDSYYAVAKPHVKSFPISIETLGFVAFQGSTEDGEYKHHYVRLSRLPKDKFESKNLTPEANKQIIDRIKAICTKPNQAEDLVFNGLRLVVARVEFSARTTMSDDITKHDTDGWLMAEVERQSNKGRVLTRYIPDNNSKSNKTFYAIFENDPNETNRMILLQNHHGSNSHSA